MAREPFFWRERSKTAGAISLALTPAALLYDLAQQTRRLVTRPARPLLPIICIGNATLGGVGKTPFAIALFKMLKAQGLNPHFLTRGYGGTETSVKVDPSRHNAGDVGDEALLLARHGTVWVFHDRPAGAAKAYENGADIVIMDDGFQNPGIEKTVSILLVDGADPAGNGKVFPAGPLREPMSRAKARANIIIYVGADETSALKAAEKYASPFAVWLEPEAAPGPQKVIAFCGIGRPEKFFATLQAAGFDLAGHIGFPDHHVFTDHDLEALRVLSKTNDAPLITTEKDFTRLPQSFAETVMTFPVAMKINNPDLLMSALQSAIDRRQVLRDAKIPSS